jgi:hypothetical protein
MERKSEFTQIFKYANHNRPALIKFVSSPALAMFTAFLHCPTYRRDTEAHMVGQTFGQTYVPKEDWYTYAGYK